MSDVKISASGSSHVAIHTFSEEEKTAFSEHINHCLSEETLLERHLPLDVNSNDLFEKSNDGLLLCCLINFAVPDTIDERGLNKKFPMNVYQKTENLNLALNAARSIGCQVINIGAADLIEGKPILILGLVWQIIRIQLLSQISLKNYPELAVLLEADESITELMKLNPETILIRWVNHQLEKSNSGMKINNFTNDIAVSTILFIYLFIL